MQLPDNDDAHRADEHARIGTKLHTEKALENAIRHYSRALELEPDLAWVWANRGWARFQDGDSDGALVDLDHAIKLDPEFVPTYGYRAWVRVRVDDFSGAIADSTLVAERFPDDPQSYVARGWIYWTSGKIDRAWDDSTFAIELDPRFVPGYVVRAWTLAVKGNVGDALKECNKALEIAPQNDQAFGIRGQIALDQGDTQDAITNFTKALTLNSQDGWHRYRRAVAYYCLSRWKEAVVDFRQAGRIAWSDPTLRDYANLREWMTDFRQGRASQNEKSWRTYLERRKTSLKGDWFRRVADFMVGCNSETDLLSASSAHPQLKTERLCQACFHIGIRRRTQGLSGAAIEAFRDCIGTGIQGYFEIPMARAELKTLNNSPAK
jgi:tetratricopeptide (TPR) repeat protein